MDKTSQRSNRNIYITVFIANLSYLAVGHSAGWSSPSLPIIMADDFYIKVNSEQASMIASLMALGGFFGPFVSGPILDVVGRKRTITVNMAVSLLAWIILACADSVEMLYLGRLVSGLTVGISLTTVSIYIAEISEPDMRGIFNNLPLGARCVTILFQYSVGPFVSYLTLILLSCVVPVVYFVLMPWMPESPYFLMGKGRREDAEKSLHWLRGGLSETAMNKEINDIQTYIDKSGSQKSSYKDLFKDNNRRVVLITFGTVVFSQIGGSTLIMFYLQPILEMTGSELPSSISAIIVGVAMVIFAFIIPGVAKKYGYKRPMIASSSGLSICLVVLGGCFFLKDRGVHHPVLNYVPVVTLISFIILCLGMLSLPWALCGEILPSSVKAQTSALSGSFSFLSGFISCVTFPYLTKSIGADFGFWLYAIICLTSAVFVYTFVPETKGLTLSEIQDVIKAPRKEKASQSRHVQPGVFIVSDPRDSYEINPSLDGTYKSTERV